MGKELFKPQKKGSLAQIALICLALLAPIHAVWAQQTATVDPTEDPLDVKDSKPYTDRTSRVSGNGVITQRLNYTEQRMLDLTSAHSQSEIEYQIGDRCVEYFRTWYGDGTGKDDSAVAGRVDPAKDWNRCKEKVLGEYATQIGKDRTYDLENKDVAKSLISTTAKTVGVTPSAAESKESSILPPLLTFGQVAHIYEGMDQAQLQARTFNENYRKYRVAYEGFVKTETVPDDPEDKTGAGGTHERIKTDGNGNPQLDEVAYQKAIDKAKRELAGQPVPKDFDARLDHDQGIRGDWAAAFRWAQDHNPVRGNPSGKNASRIASAYRTKFNGKVEDTLEAHLNTFNRSRYELLQATNKAIAKTVGGGGGFGRSALGKTPRSANKEIAGRNRGPNRGPSGTPPQEDEKTTQEEANDAKNANARIEVPQGANAQLGQFSIGYSDNGLKKMMDDAVGDVLSAP